MRMHPHLLTLTSSETATSLNPFLMIPVKIPLPTPTIGNPALMEQFNICRPGSKPPQTCLDSKTILSNTFRNVRDVVFSNDFYILALQVAHKEITDLYPFWQLRQASLSYELTIVGIERLH